MALSLLGARAVREVEVLTGFRPPAVDVGFAGCSVGPVEVGVTRESGDAGVPSPGSTAVTDSAGSSEAEAGPVLI